LSEHEPPEGTEDGLDCGFDPATHCMVLKLHTLKEGQDVMCACGNLKGSCKRKDHLDMQGTTKAETRAGFFRTVNAHRKDQPSPDAIVDSFMSQEAHDAVVAANREADDEAAASLAASSPGSGRGFRDAANAESPQRASVGGRHLFAESPRDRPTATAVDTDTVAAMIQQQVDLALAETM
jgi:hypothetical protein